MYKENQEVVIEFMYEDGPIYETDRIYLIDASHIYTRSYRNMWFDIQTKRNDERNARLLSNDEAKEYFECRNLLDKITRHAQYSTARKIEILTAIELLGIGDL